MPDINTKPIVYCGQALADYHFGESHPFGPQRHDAFITEFNKQKLDQVCEIQSPVIASQEQIELFHTHDYVEQVKASSRSGTGYLDNGDTPARQGIYEAAATVVGSVLDAIDKLMNKKARHAFVPIAGLHHAGRSHAAGFCVFNDCGVAIEYLRQQYSVQRVAYVDIDAHHGDGVFYAFEDDADICIVDVHEDGLYLYPGTGAVEETGTGEGKGHKMNIPMPMGGNDVMLEKIWPTAETFIRKAEPEFIILQCGADSLAGDPITHMRYSEHTHGLVGERLCRLANELAEGRLLALGGGGYNLNNLARAWCAVVKAMIKN